MLLMKKEFFDAIRVGAKTTTLRYWPRLMVREGSTHTIRGLGKVRIERVQVVELTSLTAADARADGFAGLAELTAALKRLYGRPRADRQLYRVHFTLLETP